MLIECELVCGNCGWIGNTSELLNKTNDINYKCCPVCESDDIVDIEELEK